MKISVVTIASSLSIITRTEALERIVDELIIGTNRKEDNKFVFSNKTKVIFQYKTELGTRKTDLIHKAKGDWILLLDTDELMSPELLREIKDRTASGSNDIHGYAIPYQNYVFGRPVYYGGEKYSKVRLFRKKYGSVTPVPIHEEVVVQGKIEPLNGVLHHYSYRSSWQVFTKFTRYAWLIAREKMGAHEQVTLSKLFLYGPHMFWARCVEDEGWRDGWRGIVLASFFGYMEGLTYWLLLIRTIFALEYDSMVTC